MNTNDNTDDDEKVPNEGAVEFIFEIYWVTLSEGIEWPDYKVHWTTS